jgi:hypothetical protein
MIYYPLFPHGCPAMPDIEIPVLIVGGSLVGLSMALLLGHHGIRALAVEHHRGTAIHPRAAQISHRTMEVFRTVGVEQIVRDKSDEQFVQDGAILAVGSLAGAEIERYIANLNAGATDISPADAASSRRASWNRSSRHGQRNSGRTCSSERKWFPLCRTQTE